MKMKIYSLLLILGIFSSCDHFLGVEQKGKVIPETVEDYDQMLNFPITQDVTNADFMVPELYIPKDQIALQETYQINGYKWEPYQYLADENDNNYSALYSRIYADNEIINNIDDAKSTMRNENLRAEVKGQAYADRARCYWALVNLYGFPYSKADADKPGVSLILENDIHQQSSRATVGEIYEQICEDLRIAVSLVPAKVAPEKKGRACRQAVEAFRAKVFLYMNELDSAQAAINKTFETEVLLEDYNNYISDRQTKPWGNTNRLKQMKDIPDILWGAMINHYIFVFNTVFVTQDLIALFDTDQDLRFLFNYSDVNPDDNKPYPATRYFANIGRRTYLISTPEIYLLKAEISARKGNYTEAMNVLNDLREKRYLDNTGYQLSASNAADALQKVKDERMREFGCTFLSWFDLRRYQAYGETVPTFTRQIGEQTVALAPGSNLYTLSIPRYVISKNPNITQNPR